jgi:hypothetical protein
MFVQKQTFIGVTETSPATTIQAEQQEQRLASQGRLHSTIRGDGSD